MFGFFEDVLKAATAAVTVPVGIAADVVTLGGELTDKQETYTGEALSDFFDNLGNATKPR